MGSFRFSMPSYAIPTRRWRPYGRALVTPWLSSDDTSEDDALWPPSEPVFFHMPPRAKPTACPACLGKGWVMEVQERSVST